jgi:hypothetical protein
MMTRRLHCFRRRPMSTQPRSDRLHVPHWAWMFHTISVVNGASMCGNCDKQVWNFVFNGKRR